MPDEDPKERVDRELIELLNELRVALPGVQVLFAFLLTVPFQARFRIITGLQKDVYMGSFLCAALAMTGVVFVITDIVFGVPAASGITAGIAAWFLWFWYGLPLSRMLADRRTATERDG